MLWDIIWNKSKFPGFLKEGHNPTPMHLHISCNCSIELGVPTGGASELYLTSAGCLGV
jgi:hypothetical protein